MSVEHSIVCDRCASTIAVGPSVAAARADAATLEAQRRFGQDLCVRCSSADAEGAGQRPTADDRQPPPTGSSAHARTLGEDLVELIVECAREAVDSRLDERARRRSDPTAYEPGSPAQAFHDRMSR